jgi:hypothetical protein
MAAPPRSDSPKRGGAPIAASALPEQPLPAGFRVHRREPPAGFRTAETDELTIEVPGRPNDDREGTVGFIAFVTSVLFVFAFWRAALVGLVVALIAWVWPRKPAVAPKAAVLTVSSLGTATVRRPGFLDATLDGLTRIDRRPVAGGVAHVLVLRGGEGAGEITLELPHPPAVLDELTRRIAAQAGLGVVRDEANAVAARTMPVLEPPD